MGSSASKSDERSDEEETLQLSEKWNAFAKEESSDFTILLGDDEFFAHRSMLVRNRYFAALFRSGRSEAREGRVRFDVSLFSPFSLVALLRFVYTGELLVGGETLERVVVMAQYVQDDALSAALRDRVARDLLDVDSFGEMRRLMTRHDVTGWAGMLRHFMLASFEQIFTNDPDTFMGLEAEDMRVATSSDELKVYDEKQLLRMVVAWLRHDYHVRSRNIATLFANLKFPFLPIDIDAIGIELFEPEMRRAYRQGARAAANVDGREGRNTTRKYWKGLYFRSGTQCELSSR